MWSIDVTVNGRVITTIINSLNDIHEWAGVISIGFQSEKEIRKGNHK